MNKLPQENLKIAAPSLNSWFGIKTFISQFIDGIFRHDLLTLSAALAFYTSLAIAPVLIITLTIVGVMGEDFQNLLLSQIQTLIGDQASVAVMLVIESTKNNPKPHGLAGVGGALVLIFSASSVFAQFENSLNVIWDVQSNSNALSAWGWVRKRLLSMGLVLSLGFLAIVSLIVSTILAFFFPNEGTGWNVVNNFVSISIFLGLFTLIFKYLPDTKVNWRQAFRGGSATAILFVIGKSLIGIYLGKSAIGSNYGAAGSLVVLLAWIYYSSAIIFAGAEITRIFKARGL